MTTPQLETKLAALEAQIHAMRSAQPGAAQNGGANQNPSNGTPVIVMVGGNGGAEVKSEETPKRSSMSAPFGQEAEKQEEMAPWMRDEERAAEEAQQAEYPPEEMPSLAGPEDPLDPEEAAEPTSPMESSDDGVYAVRYRTQRPDDPNNLGALSDNASEEISGYETDQFMEGGAEDASQRRVLRMKEEPLTAADLKSSGDTRKTVSSKKRRPKGGIIGKMVKWG